jgi:hypothetical protein
VGATLSDTRLDLAEGRRRVRAKLSQRIGATPLWLEPPAKYSFLYERAHHDSFGRTPSLLCPYYVSESGACSIWPFREAVCSTFFCKYVEGADGRAFWMSLKTFVTVMEIQLSRYLVHRIMPAFIESGHDRKEVGTGEKLSVEDLEERGPSDKWYATMWGEWSGREEAFYKGCFEIAQTLGQEDVKQVLGFDGVAGLARLERLFATMNATDLPDVLTFNASATVKWLPDDTVAFGSYSEFDAVALPAEAHALLVAFDGTQPVATVRERLRRERGADLDDEVLRVLWRHRVLVEQ